MSSTLHPAWRDYRTRRRSLVALSAVIPILAMAVAALRSATGDDAPGTLLLAAWATSLVAATVWFARFRCPYCSAHFHWNWVIANPLSDECVHCGFRRWHDPDAGRAYVCR